VQVRVHLLDLGVFTTATRTGLWNRLQRQHEAWTALAAAPPTEARTDR